MGWERRTPGGTLYYTRSRKIHGRVVREYVGGGLAGELAAALDANRRAMAQRRARAWNESRCQVEAAEADAGRFTEAVELLARAALVLAGYRQHHRGEWRKHRGRNHDEGR